MAKKKLDPVKVRQIQELLLQGQSISDILRTIIAKWSVPEEEGLQFIAAAFEDFTAKSKKSYTQSKAFHVEMRMNLYKKAMEVKDYKLAFQVLQDLAKLEDVD